MVRRLWKGGWGDVICWSIVQTEFVRSSMSISPVAVLLPRKIQAPKMYCIKRYACRLSSSQCMLICAKQTDKLLQLIETHMPTVGCR